jgi:NAD(P)-dependent dehydrogenase (short-subunit alcohol dehydrogenase family)
MPSRRHFGHRAISSRHPASVTQVDHRDPVTTSHQAGGEPEDNLVHRKENAMSERVAIVTGAGGELGRSTAEKLAAAGFTVVGVDRSEEKLKELPDGIRREPGDAADPAAARSVVGRIAAEVGPPEVLVNTIGMYHLGDALSATPQPRSAARSSPPMAPERPTPDKSRNGVPGTRTRAHLAENLGAAASASTTRRAPT